MIKTEAFRELLALTKEYIAECYEPGELIFSERSKLLKPSRKPQLVIKPPVRPVVKREQPLPKRAEPVQLEPLVGVNALPAEPQIQSKASRTSKQLAKGNSSTKECSDFAPLIHSVFPHFELFPAPPFNPFFQEKDRGEGLIALVISDRANLSLLQLLSNVVFAIHFEEGCARLVDKELFDQLKDQEWKCVIDVSLELQNPLKKKELWNKIQPHLPLKNMSQ